MQRAAAVGARVLLFGAIAILAAACSGGGGGGGSGGSGGSSTTGPGSTPAPTPQPQAQPPAAPPLDPARVATARAAIDAAVADPSIAGNTSSILVVDDETGDVVYEHNPDLPLIPASNTKLYTTAAALSLLGPDHRMETRALAAAAIDAAGNLAGDLVITSEHDFTMSAEVYEGPRYPLDRLAARLKAAGLRRVAGALRVYGAWCYDGDQFATYDPAAHRAKVEAAFLAALSAQGIAVAGGSSNVASMTPPAGLTTLATWRSVPLSVACYPINIVSHNEMADTLCRHLGFVLGGSSDYATGTRVVLDWLATIGVPAGALIYDGSGLDTRNRVSARQTVELLRRVLRSDVGSTWMSTFSIGGVTGTLAGRMSAADVRGRFFGKSGTNAGICTSGVLRNRYDGRRYVVSAFMNTLPSGSAVAARLVQDRIVEAVAVDLRGAGARPAPPVLAAVTGDRGAAHVRWGAVAGAQGYFVYPSANGETFPAAARIYTAGTALDLAGLAAGAAWAFRVTAVSAAGESDPSDAYAVRISSGAATVLVVDANDRYTGEPSSPENVAGANHDFAAATGLAIDRAGCDTCANEEVSSGAIDLASYRAVVWLTGEEGLADTPIDASEQALLRTFVAGGGGLLVSGAEVLWDLDRPQNADPEDHAFARDVLGAAYAGDDAGTYVVDGAAGWTGAGTLGFFTPGGMRISFPDQLAPAAGSGATPLLGYSGGAGGTAALACVRGAGRVVVFGFPVESLDDAGDLHRTLDAVLAWFGL